MKYKVTYNISPDDFQSIRKNIEWNKLNYYQVERALKNSMVNVSIFDDDLCVRKEYQGKGVGKLILNKLISKLYNYIPEGECFQLEASPTADNREFYIKCGLKYKPENQDGVYMWIRK